MLRTMPAAEATPDKEGSTMTQDSLRDRVEKAVTEKLIDALAEDYRGAADLVTVARDLTNVMFAELAGARPCVTCGKSIGPAKVAKGYVQCYGCRGTTIQERADMKSAHDASHE